MHAFRVPSQYDELGYSPASITPEEPPLAVSGTIWFMPWITIPHPVSVGGFRFSPIETTDPATAVGTEIADTVKAVLRCYVDQSGKVIDSCTVVLNIRRRPAWDIPVRLRAQVHRAAEMLALASLAEQRFLEGHLSPHLNATMFRLFGQGIVAGSDNIALSYARRGTGLRIGGLRFKDVSFQRPSQVEHTGCDVINGSLIKALDRARRSRARIWEPISSSLAPFLLAHAEMPDLPWANCIMLSAMAFEQLLEPRGSNAQSLAEALEKLWAPYATKTMAGAKRVKPDNDPAFANDQQSWPVHQKWMKELYEARSSTAHRGPRSEFSQNWPESQHMVIAAFVYPLAVKLKLADAGFYSLTEKELGACEALDKLLDSDWGSGSRKPPEWPSILSEAENNRALRRAIKQAASRGTQVRPKP